MKNALKAIIVFIGLIVTIVFMADNIEEWAYDKFGKEKVRDYMKKFEPYIVLSDDEEEEVVVDEEAFASGLEEEIEDIEVSDIEEV